MKDDCHDCLAAGMNDYIAKPITAQALVDTLERWFEKEEAHRHRADKKNQQMS